MSSGVGVVRVLKDLVIKVQFDADMPELNEMLYVDNEAGTPLLVSSLERGDMAVCLNIAGDRSVKKGATVRRSGRSLEIPVGDEMVGRVWDAMGRPIDGKPQLDDGRVLDVENVVWATGYRPDFSWIRLPIFADTGVPKHYRGVVTGEDGLYFVGLPFLYSFGSFLIFGAGIDGPYVAARIMERLRGPKRPASESAAGAAA